jgi:N6-L-threonylcarbamoyladenine synthase
MTVREPLVLGIETSCDETGIGIVRGRTLLSNTISSSMDEHARFGGVVPEVAARAHLEALQPAIDAAVAEAGIALTDVDAVAVTSGPGLAGALMVGIGAAKALAVGLDKPLYAVNHLVGHIAADLLTGEDVEYPTVALLVSGGHTSLLLVRDLVSDVELLGETLDDAAGEAFDKIAGSSGCPTPADRDRPRRGGRRPGRHPLPARAVPRVRHGGAPLRLLLLRLKTAVARWVEQAEASGQQVAVADVAASFREAVVDVLVTKALDACAQHGVPRLLLGGGVIANRRLREVALARAAEAGVAVRIPPLSLCTDNGAMIAALASELIASGRALEPRVRRRLDVAGDRDPGRRGGRGMSDDRPGRRPTTFRRRASTPAGAASTDVAPADTAPSPGRTAAASSASSPSRYPWRRRWSGCRGHCVVDARTRRALGAGAAGAAPQRPVGPHVRRRRTDRVARGRLGLSHRHLGAVSPSSRCAARGRAAPSRSGRCA